MFLYMCMQISRSISRCKGKKLLTDFTEHFAFIEPSPHQDTGPPKTGPSEESGLYRRCGFSLAIKPNETKAQDDGNFFILNILASIFNIPVQKWKKKQKLNLKISFSNHIYNWLNFSSGSTVAKLVEAGWPPTMRSCIKAPPERKHKTETGGVSGWSVKICNTCWEYSISLYCIWAWRLIYILFWLTGKTDMSKLVSINLTGSCPLKLL